jgi:hypothetical protein
MSKADPIRLLRGVPYSSLLQRISKARNIDLSQATDDQIRRSVGQIMHGFTTIVLDLALTGAYRARVNPDSRPFSNVSELWYPPVTLHNPSRALQRARRSNLLRQRHCQRRSFRGAAGSRVHCNAACGSCKEDAHHAKVRPYRSRARLGTRVSEPQKRRASKVAQRVCGNVEEARRD